MKRVGIYARVSTKDQNPETQLLQLREFAERRDWEVAQEFVDHGVSGAKRKRPGLDALMASVRARKVDVVLIWALDRFARSTSHLVQAAEEFAALGVDLVVLSQSIDTTTPAGRLTFQVLGAVAEFERELIRERVTAGVARARAEGKTLGRPRAEVSAERVQHLRDQGMSLRAIGKHLGVGKSTVSRLLVRAG